MMNDEQELQIRYLEPFYKNLLKKCARIALSAKNVPALRQMSKNAAHAEKPKKCGIFVRRTIAFFPRV